MRKPSPLLTIAYVAIACALIAAGIYGLAQLSKTRRANQKQTISYAAYNYNELPIDAIVINGEGGVLNAHSYSGGGAVCCVVVPSYWRPGLTAKIKWESGGHWARDAAGNFIMGEHGKVFVDGTWKERTVEIPPYIGGDGPEMGRFYIFFLPNEEVAVLVSRWGAGHPAVPYPIPVDPRRQ